MTRPVEVHKVAIESVTDASGLARLLDDGMFAADDVLAVIGKTEGNGGVNDFTRILADRAFREVLLARARAPVDEVARVPLVWSGGTDGVLSPHATVFAYAPERPLRAERRAAGGGRRRDERRAAPRGHRPTRHGREGRRRRYRRR